MLEILLPAGGVTNDIPSNHSLDIVVVTLSINQGTIDGSFAELWVVGVVL